MGKCGWHTGFGGEDDSMGEMDRGMIVLTWRMIFDVSAFICSIKIDVWMYIDGGGW